MNPPLPAHETERHAEHLLSHAQHIDIKALGAVYVIDFRTPTPSVTVVIVGVAFGEINPKIIASVQAKLPSLLMPPMSPMSSTSSSSSSSSSLSSPPPTTPPPPTEYTSCQEKRAMWSMDPGRAQDAHFSLPRAGAPLPHRRRESIACDARLAVCSPHHHHQAFEAQVRVPSRVLVVSSCRVDDVFGPRDARGRAGTFVEVADDERYWTPPIYSSMVNRLSLYEILLDALITRRRIGPNRPEASPDFSRVPRQTTRIF